MDLEDVQGAAAREELRNTTASLHAVGEVLWSVLHKDPHIPYNDHVITKVRARALCTCLGGFGCHTSAC